MNWLVNALKERKVFISLTILFGIMLLGIICFRNCMVKYTYDGTITPILLNHYENSINCTEKQFHFLQTKKDPQILFSGIQGKYEGVEISFADSVPQPRSYQLYWSKENGFQESNSYRGSIAPGETRVLVPLNHKQEWNKLRFDMDGAFTLKQLSTIQNVHPTYFIPPERSSKILIQSGIALAIYLLVLSIHLQRAKKKEHYLLSLLGKSQKARDPVYDYLRVIAVLLVIFTHVIQSDMNFFSAGTAKHYLLTCLYVLCLSCNLIYIMISGALLLPYKEEKLSHFYLHRVTRVALPMLVYFAFYLWRSIAALGGMEPASFMQTVKGLFTGETPMTPHYWLMYIILSLYVIYPFLRYMIKSMNYQILTKMIVAIITLMACTTYWPMFLGKFAFPCFLASWTGVAFIGYWLTREETRKYDPILLAVGGISAIVIAITIRFQVNFLEFTTNTALCMVLFSTSIVALLLKYRHGLSVNNAIVNFLSKYSYSIILIHWWVLYLVVQQKFDIHVYQYKLVGGLFIAVFLVLLISSIMAFLIDNTVITILYAGYSFIIHFIKEKKEHIFPEK